MSRVLITCRHLQRHMAGFEAEFAEREVEPFVPEFQGQQLGSGELIGHLPGVEAMIAGDDVIDRAVLEAGAADKLRSVIKWGIGTDAIDKKAASSLGISVHNTPGAFGEEVADLALSHILLLSRGLHRMHMSVASGGWLQIEGRTLAGSTVGIVGLGFIGRAIARRCVAFGMTVIGHDIAVLEPADTPEDVGMATTEELLRRSDYVVLACALTEENHHMIDTKAIAAMKSGAFLVNVARGPLVDEAALAEALRSGRLAGAGLDVYETEPLPSQSPLRGLDNIVFGTHCGSNTTEAVQRVNRWTVDLLWHVLGKSELPAERVNRLA